MTSRKRVRRRVPVAVAIVIVSLAGATAVAPPPAQANYTVVECVYAAAVGAPDVILSQGGSPKVYAANDCLGAGPRSGWGLGLEANGVSQANEWKAWMFAAPTGTRFASARATVHQDARYGYGGLLSCSGGTQGFSGPWSTPACDHTAFFQVSLHCFASPCSSPGNAGDAYLSGGFAFVTSFFANVADLVPPALAASGGVLQGGVVRGNQRLDVGASDSGGGVRSVEVQVNGTPSRSTGAFCSPNSQTGGYTSLQPCPLSLGAALNLDTEKDPGWANGPNDLRICAVDVGGNASQCVRRTVHVDNSCPASGGTAASSLSSGVDSNGQLRQRVTARSTESPVVRGTLVNSAGQPAAGASVCVYETVELADGSRELVATATTQGNGRFATKLDPGPSRKVDVVYRYNDKQLSESLWVDSSVVPTLTVADRSLANGESARFRGQLPGPFPDGRAVTLQARAGKKWRTFKQVRSDALGRFRGRYRFTRTAGRVRYTFRVLVKRQNGYPFEPGASRRQKVLVVG